MDYQTFEQSMIASNTLGALLTAGADISQLGEELPQALAYAHSVLAPTYSDADRAFYMALHQGFLNRGAFESGTLEAILQDPTTESNQIYLENVTREAVLGTYGEGEKGLEMYLANAQAGLINGIEQSGIELIDENVSDGNQKSATYALQLKSPEQAQAFALLQANFQNKLEMAEQIYGVSLTQKSQYLSNDWDIA